MAGLQALQNLIQPIVALIANIANSQPKSPDSLTSAAWYDYDILYLKKIYGFAAILPNF
jgi:hypothetical protein